LRCGAKVGDALCITGKVGFSLAERHWNFTPRIREAQRLHQLVDLHAMMDLSDGLGSDLFHIARESRCGLVIDADQLPIHDRPAALDDERSRLDHALNDGEDFELLFAASRAEADWLVKEQPLSEFGVDVASIGEVVAQAGVYLSRNGVTTEMPRGGFTHRW
jgi:thiamine-monophosphate kinase